MLRLLLLLCLPIAWGQTNAPGAVKYLGLGYHGLLGNPEGSPSTNGGIDPGLDLLHRVMELTYDEGKQYNGYDEPDQVEYGFSDTCSTVRTIEHAWGGRSYLDHRLKEYWRKDPEHNNLEDYEFTLSEAYASITNSVDNGIVFYDEKDVCNQGNARYMLENIEAMKYPLNLDFVAAVCDLPEEMDILVYTDFVDTWGTDVVVEVSLGQKSTARYETDRLDFVFDAAETYPETIIYSGFYNGYTDSIRVNMTQYSQSVTSTNGQLTATFQTSDAQLSEPIQTYVISIDDILGPSFWARYGEYYEAGICTWPDVSELLIRQINVLKTLEVYAEDKNIEAPSDPFVITAVTWPEGRYGFPETIYGEGCPSSPDFTFDKGWRYHDTRTLGGQNDWSDPYDLRGPYGRNNMQQNFCMKENANAAVDAWRWMKGEYCIFRASDDDCPAGFFGGYVFWDDENVSNNNDAGGFLPHGVYTEDTLIYYCCRQDATPDTVMYLPTDRTFALIKRTPDCPTVYGMSLVSASHQFFYWECSDLMPNSHTSGFHPLEDGGEDNHRLHYCLYYN